MASPWLWQVESDHNFGIVLEYLASFAHDVPNAADVKAGNRPHTL